jgi:hypothetical protein
MRIRVLVADDQSTVAGRVPGVRTPLVARAAGNLVLAKEAASTGPL